MATPNRTSNEPTASAEREDGAVRLGRVEAGGEIHFCEPDGDGVRVLDGSIAKGFTRGSQRLATGTYRQLSPVQPGKVLVVLGAFRPDPAPEFAAKLPSAVIAPGAAIVVPPEIGEDVTVEPELA